VVLPTPQGSCLKSRIGTTPEPVHRQTYSTLRIPLGVTKPRQPWEEVPK
jgi:hypothetical protein